MTITKEDLLKKYGIYLPKGKYSVKVSKGMYVISTVKDDTEGCILVGDSYSKDIIYNSRITFDKLFLEIKNCISIRKEPVTIEITSP